MKTWSMPLGSGFGATTNGWRPISVKIQPAALAPKGARMPNTARRMSHGRPGTVPLRVAQSATSGGEGGEAAEADHHPEAPVGDLHDGHVLDLLAGAVAVDGVVRQVGAVLGLVLGPAGC